MRTKLSNTEVLKSEGSKQRNLQMMGQNLQIVAKRLLANQILLRYLYYDNQDPLSKDLPDVTTQQVMGGTQEEKLIRIVPIIEYKDDSKSLLSIRVVKGMPEMRNTEFMDIMLDIEVFVPVTKWIIKSDNLRPFLIMSEISKSLAGTEIEGLGTIIWDSFSLNFLTEEMSGYNMMFHFTQFN